MVVAVALRVRVRVQVRVRVLAQVPVPVPVPVREPVARKLATRSEASPVASAANRRLRRV